MTLQPQSSHQKSAVDKDRRRTCSLSLQKLPRLKSGQARDGKRKQMSLTGEEFISRWMQHILPERFVKIRHYGFLANRDKNKKLQLIAAQLGHRLPPPLVPLDYKERLKLLMGIDLDECPHCKTGKMITVNLIERGRSP